MVVKAPIHRKVKVASVWGYMLNAGIIAFVGIVEDERICSALPDWASAIVLPLVPALAAGYFAYMAKAHPELNDNGEDNDKNIGEL